MQATAIVTGVARTDGRRVRGRKPTDPQVILDALERCLDDAPLHAVKIQDIVAAGAFSRPTFYAHFETKFAAAAALLERIVDEIGTTMAAFVQRPAEAPVDEGLRRGIDDSVDVWFRHHRILNTAVEHAHAVPELARGIEQLQSTATREIAAEIERQRAAGLAPPGIEAVALSRSLVEATVALLYRSSRGNDPLVPTPPLLNATLLALWTGTVYHRPVDEPR